MICPNCGAMCDRDEVHNGVVMLYGPWGCYCGWSERAEYNLLDGPKLTPDGYELDQWGGATPPRILESEIHP